MEEKLIVSHAPHIAGKDSLQRIMLQVIIAMLPALAAGCLVFGYRALVVTLVCVLSCVVFEGLWQKILRKPVTVSDFSAVVTGMLLAFNLPASIPLWMAVIGSFFAIIVVKQFFGGLGHNFMNPALGARAFLLASWALAMTTWPQPGSTIPLFGSADVVTSATPLALYAENAGTLPSYLTLFLGNTGGCIGETSALAILIGGIYLLLSGVIRLRIPVCFIGTVALGTWIFGGHNGFFTGDWLYQILSGGLMLGAFFMATDYATTPFTPKGQLIFGIGCGIITVLIRLWGGYPEGVSYSILLMNVVTPLIDKVTAPRRYGTTIKKEAA
ncbi:MAG: RnfABCDGE type electron transport complex subunit D [Clostridia bacterium]|nr:RnfABCDGE type electron transport complex subunit D [Clostridia bacterium]